MPPDRDPIGITALVLRNSRVAWANSLVGWCSNDTQAKKGLLYRPKESAYGRFAFAFWQTHNEL